MPRHRKNSGFALLMVLMLIGISMILGVTYASSASLKQISSSRFVGATRARYLAESGLQHAMYICKINPKGLATTSAASMMGPFYADNTQDSYRFYAKPNPLRIGEWTVVATGTCGTISQTVSATVFRDGGTSFTGGQSMVGAGRPITIPSGVVITGDLTVNGDVVNKGQVKGQVNYTGIYTLSGGTATKIPVKISAASVPSIVWSDYLQYTMNSTTYSCKKTTLWWLDPGMFANNTCVATDNPGGVLQVPAGTYINDNFTFKGTILVNGNLYILGRNIRLEAVHGFPAIIATGKIYIAESSEITVDGLVYAAQGMLEYLNDTYFAHTRITGGFVSQTRSYDAWLQGTHELTFNADRCILFDPKDNTNDAATAKVKITSWNE